MPQLSSLETTMEEDITLPSDDLSLPPSIHSTCSASAAVVADEDEDMPDDCVTSDFELPPDPDTELPPDPDTELLPDLVNSDEDTDCNSFDEDIDCVDAEGDPDTNDVLITSAGACHVPTPGNANRLSGYHDVAEFYSPPRLAPEAQRQGFIATLSCDLSTGWDFRLPDQKELAKQLLVLVDILFVMLCPPCTIFSILQRIWNMKRWTKSYWDARWDEGVSFVAHSMECAKIQLQSGHYFAFEHPYRSGAWTLDCVEEIQAWPGVDTVDFDMCMFGLRAPSGLPMRKRTRVMTNLRPLADSLRGRFCDKKCHHHHQIIQGVEAGVARSVWAQTYPEEFVRLIASLLPRRT